MVSRLACSSQRDAPQVEYVACTTTGLAQDRCGVLERCRQRSSITAACKGRTPVKPTAQHELIDKAPLDPLLFEIVMPQTKKACCGGQRVQHVLGNGTRLPEVSLHQSQRNNCSAQRHQFRAIPLPRISRGFVWGSSELDGAR